MLPISFLKKLCEIPSRSWAVASRRELKEATDKALTTVCLGSSCPSPVGPPLGGDLGKGLPQVAAKSMVIPLKNIRDLFFNLLSTPHYNNVCLHALGFP